MKKIIAAAVASAFVAPAFAADVSVSGAVKQFLIDEQVVGTSTNRHGSEQAFTVGASSEANNGLTVSATINITASGSNDGGEALTLSHASFGSIAIGNPSGAVDAVDDKTEILELMDPTIGNADSTVLWTLPTLAEGLTVYASYSPTNGDAAAITKTSDVGGITTGADNSWGDSANDDAGIALTYQMGPVRVAYGQNDEAAEDNTFMGVQYSANGLMAAYETNETKTTSTNAKVDQNAFAVSYTMGDVAIKALTTTKKNSTATTEDRTAYGIHYNLGGGASFIVETGSEEKLTSKGEFVGAGVVFKF